MAIRSQSRHPGALTYITEGPLADLVASRSVDTAVGTHRVLLALIVQLAVGCLVRGAVWVL